MPQAADGNRIDPPVSGPIDAKHSPAEVAIPEPLDDPPGHKAASHGLSGTGISGWYQATANSVRFSLPIRIAPAASKRLTTVAFESGRQSCSTLLAQVVVTPCVKHRSLTATGTP